MTAREAVAALKAGELQPAELLTAAFERMDRVEPAVNATVIRAEARAERELGRLSERQAAQGTHRGWLAGLPVTIKDLIAVEGLRATSGSRALADFVPAASDALIERLEARGAIISGKTNTPEFGTGANTFNAVFGHTRNPWDTSRNPGGSSGGAAVSLATGETWLAHGSDMAGSLRTPAALCGVVGFRPTPGRAGGGPVANAFALEPVQGPMARNVGDVALFLDAMAGFDPRHPLSVPETESGFQAALDLAPGDIRVAFSADQAGLAPVETPIRTALTQAMQALAGEGVTVEQDWPDVPELPECYLALRGIMYATVHAALPDAVQAALHPMIRESIELGQALSSDEIFAALQRKTVIYERLRLFFERYDVLAGPVVGLEPGPFEQIYPPSVDGVACESYTDWLWFSFLATTCGLPALSLPCGFTEAGLPVGLQLIGPPRGEARLLQIAQEFERRLGLDLSPLDPRGSS